MLMGWFETRPSSKQPGQSLKQATVFRMSARLLGFVQSSEHGRMRLSDMEDKMQSRASRFPTNQPWACKDPQYRLNTGETVRNDTKLRRESKAKRGKAPLSDRVWVLQGQVNRHRTAQACANLRTRSPRFFNFLFSFSDAFFLYVRVGFCIATSGGGLFDACLGLDN
jgi:hypothetical protein